MSSTSSAGTPLRTWAVASLLFLCTFALYAAFSGDRLRTSSADNHFVYLADSYLHGTTKMRVTPPHRNDWASYERLTLASGEELRGTWVPGKDRVFQSLSGEWYAVGADELPVLRAGIPPRCRDDLPPVDARVVEEDRRCADYFVSFPPGPAVLMLPGVAIWGMAFNDVLFTLLFAAGSAASIFLLLERLRREERFGLRAVDSVWLTVFFALGSCAAWCSVFGQVWFTAMVVGTFFSIWFVYFAWGLRSPFLAGLMLAGAFSARTPYVFAAIFMGWLVFFPGGRFQRPTTTQLRQALTFGAAPLVVGGLMLLQNQVRFESWSEFGHRYLSHGQNPLIFHYGLFNTYFASLNLGAMFAALPQLIPHEPYVVVSRHGLALWFSMPAMLWSVWPRSAERLPGDAVDSTVQLRRASYLAIAVIAVTHVFYHNTGWVQFSYRFAMDYLVFIVVLVAVSGHRLGWRFRAAVMAGVVVNVFGAITFGRFDAHYAAWFFEALSTAP